MANLSKLLQENLADWGDEAHLNEQKALEHRKLTLKMKISRVISNFFCCQKFLLEK